MKQQGQIYSPGKPGSALETKPFNPLPSQLEKVSAVFLSQEDLDGYANDDLFKKLLSHVPIVVVTLGEEGARIHLKNKTLNVGVRRTRAQDPTGAGDTFASAFLYALANGGAQILRHQLNAGP